MDTVVIWSILHFYMTSKYLPQGQVLCLWFSEFIAHLLECQMEWTKDMSRSALCYKLSIYCYSMERQSVLDWKSQCTTWSQHSCMQITSHSLSSYFQWSSNTLQCQLILHVDMDWLFSLVSQRISTIMTLSLDLNWFMIYVYLMYKYWTSIKTPGLHSLIKHSSALLSNDDSVFDVITDHRICFKVNQVVIIGEF